MINHIHPISAFSDNYIWAIHEAGSSNIAIVDPGDPHPVIDYVQAKGLTLSHILITHHHSDHIGGLPLLIETCNPVVYGPEPSGIKGISRFLHEGDCIDLFGRKFEIFEVPGHTLDHIAYFSAAMAENSIAADNPVQNGIGAATTARADDGKNTINTALLFCGDTLFAAGCGRLFEGTPKMMLESLHKLAALDPDTAVFCTHEYTLANLDFALAAEGNNPGLQSRVSREEAKRKAGQPTLPSSIALELETNPFLRCNQPEVIQRVSAATGIESTEAVDVFAALRSWKDNF